jgi:ankyrin repeat protein
MDDSLKDSIEEYLKKSEECETVKHKYRELKQCSNQLFDYIVETLDCGKLLWGNDMLYGREKAIDDLLVIASYKGRIDVVRLCIEHNAEDSTNGAFLFAAEKGHVDVVKLLMEKCDYAYPLLQKAKKKADDLNLYVISDMIQIQILKKTCFVMMF